MANYNQMVLTKLGMNLFAKVQSGELLNFTKFKVGSGQLGSVDPVTLTTLVSPIMDVPISTISAEGAIAYIKGISDNALITTAIYVCELGLYANDPQLGEILYGYANAGIQGDTIPPISSGPFSRQYQINTTVGNATNVTAIISPNSYMPTIEKGSQGGIALYSDALFTVQGVGTNTIVGVIAGMSSYFVNLKLILNLQNSNTGGTTLNINNLGARDIKYSDSAGAKQSLPPGYLLLNSKVILEYDGNDFTIISNDTLFNAHIIDYVKHPAYITTTGVANTYVATLNPAPTSYMDGLGIVAKINVASTGASTINANGLGAKPILDSFGNSITAGGLKANTPYTLRYESTSQSFIVQGKGGGGNSVASDLRLGKTATVDTGQIIGTLDLTNLLAQNILNGITIGGVTGTAMDARTVTAGTFIVSSNLASVCNLTTTLKKMKETQITGAIGMIRVSFYMQNDISPYTSYARIYKNGFAIGTQRSTTISATYVEDITVGIGDYVQVYGYVSDSAGRAIINNLTLSIGIPQNINASNIS